MHDYTLTQAQAIETRNMEAERIAREHRLDLDRVVSAALDILETHSRMAALYGNESAQRNAYLVGYTGVRSTTDVLSLIDELRRTLSPAIR